MGASLSITLASPSVDIQQDAQIFARFLFLDQTPVASSDKDFHIALGQDGTESMCEIWRYPGPVSTDILNASQRNLPESVPLHAEETPEETLLKKAYQIYIERGLDPEEVGRVVLEAIREEQFYVITHDYSSAVETRMQNILNARNPEPQPPTAEFLKIVEELIGK